MGVCCIDMYCSQLWRDFRSCSIRQLTVGYNHSFRYIMNYPRKFSAVECSSLIIYLVLWNCGATIFWLYTATHKQWQFSRRCHCFVLSAVIRSVEALGVCVIHLNQLPWVVFYVFFICILILFSLFVRKTLASVLIILYIYVFDQGLYHDLYFEYGPSLSSVVGLK